MTAPNITLREEDQSTFVQTYSASQAGFAGEFNWGPADYFTLVTNEGDLATKFGVPTLENNETFYTVIGYLDYSDNLAIVRSVGEKAMNATDGKKQYITAQISNVEGQFQVGETFTTSDEKTATIINITETELTYWKESDQLADDTTITGDTSKATATITSAGKSYRIMSYTLTSGELAAEDTLTGGTSSATATIVALTDNTIIYQLTSENDFSSGESAVSNTGAAINITNVGGIYNYVIAGTLIKNNDVFENLASKDFIFAARYPGSLGNTIKVSVAKTSNFDTWTYKSLFDSAPDDGEIHVVVIDNEGKFYNSFANRVLETYSYLSLDVNGKDVNGQPNYYRTIINNNSSYIYAGDKDIDDLEMEMVLTGGVDSAPEEADIINSYKVFDTPVANDVFYYFTGLYTNAVDNSVISMAEGNMKTVLFTSPSRTSVMSGDNQTRCDNIVQYVNGITASNRVFVDGNWRQVLDTYNNSLVWVPCCSATCGLSSRCDTNYDVWVSPMGYTRGIYVNTTKLAWEPEKQYRDTLYKNSINPIFTDGSDGVVLLGDRMHVIKPSYLRQLAVRKTIIVIEQSAISVLKYFLGENNNEQTRSLARAKISSFLRTMGAQGAFRRAQVVLDSTNNTEQVIDEQKMLCLIKIQPQSSINYIELTLSVVNSAAQITENVIPGTF